MKSVLQVIHIFCMIQFVVPCDEPLANYCTCDISFIDAAGRIYLPLHVGKWRFPLKRQQPTVYMWSMYFCCDLLFLELTWIERYKSDVDLQYKSRSLVITGLLR